MIEHRKLFLTIAICLCHYSLSIKQTNNFKEEKYNIKNTLFMTNKNTDIPVIKAKLNESNAYMTLPRRKREQKVSVTRKQYEIINMLWRKTKFFVDFDENTTLTPKLSLKINRSLNNELHTKKMQQSKHYLYTENPKLSPTTSSFIEFYYLDELDGYIKKKGYVLHSDKKFGNSRMGNNKLDRPTPEVIRQPVFAFDSGGSENNDLNKESTNVNLDIEEHQNNYCTPQSNNIQNETTKIYNNLNNPKMFATQMLSENDINESQWLSLFFSDPLTKNRTQFFTKSDISSESSTSNDKIKFFELYDSNTIATTKGTDLREQTLDNMLKTLKNDKVYNNNTFEQKIINRSEIVARSSRNLGNKKRDVLNVSYKKFNITQSITKRQSQALTTKKKTKIWSEYPYTSVFIFEPLSIYCDTAAINAYWLIAAGSCLAGFNDNKLLTERSAYIAYCGDDWWEPESIVYVRRSIVHPLYLNRKKKRRHLYNIGVVQVITSLINNCNGWAPVSLVAHQFSVNEKGFPALALGWGLDRYSGEYSYYHIEKHSLAAYKGTIYPKSCPDTSGYGYVKEFSETNIFCLSLPFKNASQGSLLLVEGKLIALFLQRRRGLAYEDSMQYTGIWRLIPWIQNLTYSASEQIRKSYDKINI